VKQRCTGCTAVFDGRANRRYCSPECKARAKLGRHRNRARGVIKSITPLGPVQSVIYGTNGDLIAQVARLRYLGGPEDRVLDVTYGEGSFWTRYRPAGLVAHDLYKLDGVSFLVLPEPDDSERIVVYDPPYISTGNRATSTVDDLYDRFGLGELKGWRAIRRQIELGLAECARVLTPKGFLLVKCMDYTESGKKVWNTFHVFNEAERLGLRMVDRFTHYTGGGPQPMNNLDGSPREQRTSREVTSMLLVFTK